MTQDASDDLDERSATARLNGTFAQGHTEAVVRANLQRTRETGYSVNPGLVLEGS